MDTDQPRGAPSPAKLRSAVCPACSAEVTVTYWPYGVPLYAVHLVRGTNRDCGKSLRPVDAGPGQEGRRRS